MLAIASKNEETVALEAIRKHSEMVLREEDFAAFRINWRDKARNVRTYDFTETLQFTITP